MSNTRSGRRSSDKFEREARVVLVDAIMREGVAINVPLGTFGTVISAEGDGIPRVRFDHAYGTFYVADRRLRAQTPEDIEAEANNALTANMGSAAEYYRMIIGVEEL